MLHVIVLDRTFFTLILRLRKIYVQLRNSFRYAQIKKKYTDKMCKSQVYDLNLSTNLVFMFMVYIYHLYDDDK